MRIVPGLLSSVRSVNDGGYLPRNEVPNGVKLQKKRKYSVEFHETESSSSPTCFRSYKLLAFRTWQNLKYYKELHVGYGRLNRNSSCKM